MSDTQESGRWGNMKMPYKTASHVYVHYPSESVMCRKCAAKISSANKTLIPSWPNMGNDKCEHCGGDLWGHLKNNADGTGFDRAEGNKQMAQSIKKSFAEKQKSELDQANSDVENDGDVDGDPANNFRSNKPVRKKTYTSDEDDQAEDDDTGDGESDSGANGYADPADGDGSPDDENEGDDMGQEVTKADTEEVVAVIKAEEMLDWFRTVMHDEMQIMKSEIVNDITSRIPNHFASALVPALDKVLTGVNNKIVTLSKSLNDFAEHLDERLDDVDNLQETISKSFNLAGTVEANVTHTPLQKSDTVRYPIAKGVTLNPEHTPPASYTNAVVDTLVKKGLSLQQETGARVPGLHEVTSAINRGSISKQLVDVLQKSVDEIQKSVDTQRAVTD